MDLFRAGTIGFDVDRGAIKAVQLGRSAEGYVLRHVGYHRLPEGVVNNGEISDPDLLASEIRAFWKLHSFRGRNVMLGVSGSNVAVRFVDFPRLSPDDLASALRFQAEDHIPMPVEDVILDHVVLGAADENPEEDRIVLVAAQKGMISDCISALREGGLRANGIDVKALALTRSTLPESLFDEEETVLLLDIGTEISNLVVVQGTRPTLAQFLPTGFDDFVESVADSAEIEPDLAEKQALNPLASLATTNDPGTSEDRTRHLNTAPDDETVQLPESRKNENDQAEPESQVEKPAREDENNSNDEADQNTGDSDDISDEVAPDQARTEELSSDPALIFDVRRGLESVAMRLAGDVRKAVAYHDSRPRAKEVTRVLISGEGALIRGLDEFLGVQCGLRAETARPTSKITANRSNISDEQLAAMEPVLAIALGLAMDET